MSRAVVSRPRGCCLGPAALLLLWGLPLGPACADSKLPPPAVDHGGASRSASDHRGASRSASEAALQHINDVRYGGRGTDPIPLQPTPVQLRSAEVQLTEIPIKDGWQVSATYELANPGAAPAALSLLLAEQRCPPAATCSAQVGAFQELSARFGDKLIEATTAPPDVVKGWADPPGQGHLYQLSVPAGQPTRLSVEYLLDRSSGGQLFGIQYLSSAHRWGGAVEHVRYIVELKQPTPYVIFPQAFKLAGFTEQANARGAGSITRMVFTADVPKGRGDGDFLAIFPADALAGSTPAGYCAGFRGDQSDEELAQTLARYTPDLLRACRDQVLALHGAPFQEPALRTRYYGTPPKLPAWADAKAFAIAPRPENPAFHKALLGPGERSYLHGLEEAERHIRR